jgi:hypothetical protein
LLIETDGFSPRVQHLTHEQVERQHDAYAALALIFQRRGMRVYVRETFQGEPRAVVDTEATDSAASA